MQLLCLSWCVLRALQSAAEGAELVSAGRAVEALRVVKDDDEVDALRRACAVADRALAEALSRLKPAEAAGEVAKALGLSRRDLYRRALELKAEPARDEA